MKFHEPIYPLKSFPAKNHSSKFSEGKRPSILGMKDFDNNYIISIISFDQGMKLTSSILESFVIYSELKDILKFDYKYLYRPQQLMNDNSRHRDVLSAKRNHIIITADELDEYAESGLYDYAYIFYPSKYTWNTYRLPEQELIIP